MDDIDAMVETLSAALSEMMTDDGSLPGSVLETAMHADDPLEQAATLLVFTSKLLGVSVAVADMVVGRFTDAVELAGDAVIDVDSLDRLQIVIVGRDLPGRSFHSADGKPLDEVHVGVQIRAEAEQLVAGDAPSARWVLEVKHSTDDDGSVDFKGPAVHGKRGERFLYLTWGNLAAGGTFAMFRRAKLMLNRIDPALVEAAASGQRPLVAHVLLTDERGGPRCARVDPPGGGVVTRLAQSNRMICAVSRCGLEPRRWRADSVRSARSPFPA